MTSKLFSLFLVILVLAVNMVAADMPAHIVAETPASAVPAAPIDSSALTASQIVAERLRRMYPQNEVGIVTEKQIVYNNEEDANSLMNRLSSKYSVYKKLPEYKMKPANPGKEASPLDLDADGNTAIEADYKSVFANANVRAFNPKFDNPDNLETMLSSMWGKRYGHMNTEQRELNAVNENVLIIKATTKATERLSQGLSTDGSVDKFIAVADMKHKKKAKKSNKPFKPTQYWEGPRIYGTAMDITGEAVSANTTRTPAAPPKPPVDSYIFPETSDVKPGDAPVTIIQTITVTKPAEGAALPAHTTFTPIMTNDLKGATVKPFIA